MPRPPRHLEPGLYHLTSCGVRDERIFLTGEDGTSYLELIGEVSDPEDFFCRAYTLMPTVGFSGALLLAPVLTAVLGLIVERVLIRRLYGRDPLYSLLLNVGQSIYVVIVVFGLFVAGAMGLVQLWFSHNRRAHPEEIERLLAFARAEDPHHPG